MSKVYLKGFLGTLAFTLLVFWGWTYYSSKNNTQAMPERFKLIEQLETQGMPAFKLTDLTGKAFSSDTLKGKTVLLNFWASWCAPCVSEFPSMVEITNRMKGDLVFVAISHDKKLEDIQLFLKAMKQESPHMYLLWDKDKSVGKQFGVEMLPETFVFRKDGRLERKVIGEQNWTEAGAEEFFKRISQK